MGRIDGTLDYDDFGDVDFVIEAAPEKMEIKQAVFAELDAVTPGHAILASNTSSLSITEMGLATLRPDKVCGFHFFFPASVMPLVEVDCRRGHLRGDPAGGLQLRAGDPQAADHLRGGSRLRRQPHPQLRGRRGLARAGGERAFDQEDRRGRGRGQDRADGSVHPRRHAGPRHDRPRRRAPQRVLRRQLLRPQGHEGEGRGGQARPEERGRGPLQGRRAAGPRRRRPPRRPGRPLHR